MRPSSALLRSVREASVANHRLSHYRGTQQVEVVPLTLEGPKIEGQKVDGLNEHRIKDINQGV